MRANHTFPRRVCVSGTEGGEDEGESCSGQCHADLSDGGTVPTAESGCTFTHGVAAKLINIYCKSMFVCGGYALQLTSPIAADQVK